MLGDQILKLFSEHKPFENIIDEIVIDTINELKKVQDTFNTDSIEVLNEDAQFENVCEVVSDENKNN